MEKYENKPLSKVWWIALFVGAIASILNAVAPDCFGDLRAWVGPGQVGGKYVVLLPDDDLSQPVRAFALKAKSHGNEMWADDGDGDGDKPRVYQGFMNSGYLTFSYRSKDPNGIGFGQYFLEPRDAQGTEFAGQMAGHFCDYRGQQPRRRIMQCNVVMVKGELGGDEEQRARLSYKDYLSKACVLRSEAKSVPVTKCGGTLRMG